MTTCMPTLIRTDAAGAGRVELVVARALAHVAAVTVPTVAVLTIIGVKTLVNI